MKFAKSLLQLRYLLLLKFFLLIFIKHSEHYYKLCSLAQDESSACYSIEFYNDYCDLVHKKDLPMLMNETIRTTYLYLSYIELPATQTDDCNMKDMLYAKINLKLLKNVFALIYFGSLFMLIIKLPALLINILQYLVKRLCYFLFVALVIDAFCFIALDYKFNVVTVFSALKIFNPSNLTNELAIFKIFLEKMN